MTDHSTKAIKRKKEQNCHWEESWQISDHVQLCEPVNATDQVGNPP